MNWYGSIWGQPHPVYGTPKWQKLAEAVRQQRVESRATRLETGFLKLLVCFGVHSHNRGERAGCIRPPLSAWSTLLESLLKSIRRHVSQRRCGSQSFSLSTLVVERLPAKLLPLRISVISEGAVGQFERYQFHLRTTTTYVTTSLVFFLISWGFARPKIRMFFIRRI